MSLRATSVVLPETASDDPRVGHLLGTALSTGDAPLLSIVGFPVDEGVVRNGGRAGASEGPGALRQQLWTLCPDADNHARFCELLSRTRDLGDLIPSGDLERDQAALGEVVGAELERGARVLVLGGGHETSYGHFLGYVAAAMPVAIDNLDAHLDVRPLEQGQGHSGSPFRQALQHPSGLCRDYRVHGLSRPRVARAHLDWLAHHGGSCGFAEELTLQGCERLYADAGDGTAVLATFCLDAVDQAFAPGVSAPSTAGLSSWLWLVAAHRAGRAEHVRSYDVVELNPRFDRDHQTARLAAATVWQILRGLAEQLPFSASP